MRPTGSSMRLLACGPPGTNVTSVSLPCAVAGERPSAKNAAIAAGLCILSFTVCPPLHSSCSPEPDSGRARIGLASFVPKFRALPRPKGKATHLTALLGDVPDRETFQRDDEDVALPYASRLTAAMPGR